MRPLILKFKEDAHLPEIDFSQVEYDSLLNLNVDRKSRQPVVASSSLITSTGTKTWDEGSDHDKEQSQLLMITSTSTHTTLESSDSDPRRHVGVSNLITMTATRQMIESSDTD